MKKIMVHRPGGFKQLTIESFPDPEPGDDQVLIRTQASGVNFADCFVRMGYYASAKKYFGWPISPGFEFSGVIERIGKRVKEFKIGDRVFGITRFNGYATHIISLPYLIFHIPGHASFKQAAAFPSIYLTAYYALHMCVYIYPDSLILVHSAAGGVGSAILQLCKRAGWRTIGVVGATHKVEAAQSMGADTVIDKSKEDLWSTVERHAPEGCDIVLDGNGALTLKQSYRHLKPTGKLISYGFHSMFSKKRGMPNLLKLAWDYLRTPRFNPIDMHEKNRSIVTFNLSFLFDHEELLKKAMADLYTWYTHKEIRVPQITTYDFVDVARAHEALQSGSTVGKLVLVFSSL